jgi:preprotein translocase subunit SecF
MRFPSWRFSFANIISLMHDVLVILIFLMWANIEISLDSLIAILFIIGYSINDTIVIFAKIRELMRNDSIMIPSEDIINKSISITLKRTLLTSGFTFLVVFPLWLFGGNALENLAAPILLGILFGTYSSIAIACSILYDSFLFFKNRISKEV